MAISMLKIRRPLGRLIFNMGIAIPGKTVFLIETAPSSSYSMAYILKFDGRNFDRNWSKQFVSLLWHFEIRDMGVHPHLHKTIDI